MDALLELVRGLADTEESLRILFIGLAAIIVFVLVLGTSYLLMGASDPVRRRLGELTVDDELPRGRMLVHIQTALGPVAKYVMPTAEIERTTVTRRLVHAGFRGPNAMQTYYALKALLAVLPALLVVAVAQWLPSLKTGQVMFYAVLASGVGVLAPNVILSKLVKLRMRKLRNGFPDALDLMVVCVEAGLGMAQAIQRVADELGVSHPELGEELALVNAEIRAGVDRMTALRNLSDRTGLEEIRGLVSLLIQTLRFGTSIGDSLRVYSEEFRDQRTQQAEEVAATMGTRMMFPLILFLFPGFFVIAIGPAVIQLVQVFKNM
jgi:tight adherence protein C